MYSTEELIDRIRELEADNDKLISHSSSIEEELGLTKLKLNLHDTAGHIMASLKQLSYDDGTKTRYLHLAVGITGGLVLNTCNNDIMCIIGITCGNGSFPHQHPSGDVTDTAVMDNTNLRNMMKYLTETPYDVKLLERT